MTFVVLGAVFVLAFALGASVATSWLRWSVVFVAGFGVMAGTVAVMWATGPTWGGWSDRVLLYGHWIDQRWSDLIAMSTLPWTLGLGTGAATRPFLQAAPARHAESPPSQ